MKKKKAITIIQNQINKLQSSKDFRTISWVIETRTYIITFFGVNSHLISIFNYYDWTYSPGFEPVEQK